MTDNKIINLGGVNGSGKGIVNVNSKEYKALQETILTHSNQQTREQIIKYNLIALKLQMESYVSNQNNSKLITVGSFLKKFLIAIGIKNKDFAKYIDLKESNLSSILKNRRKVNIDLAFKLGQIFNINPNLWLLVQSKNDLFEVSINRKLEYKKYKLEELLKKTG